MVLMVKALSSSEAQGQIVGPRESLNWRKNMARRKVKNGEKSPWDNVLPDQFQTVAAFLTSDWCQKTFVFFLANSKLSLSSRCKQGQMRHEYRLPCFEFTQNLVLQNYVINTLKTL